MSKGLYTLREGLRGNNTLSKLLLSQGIPEPDNPAAIGEFIKTNKRLTTLGLKVNKFEIEHFRSLKEGLRNLGLSKNRFEIEKVQILSEAIRKTRHLKC